MGIGRLCMLFGKTRQAYYDRKTYLTQQQKDEMIALELVAGIRRDLPGLGIQKLHWLMRKPLATNGIKMGRDKLGVLLGKNGLLIRKGRKTPKTTNSRHWLKKYPDLTKELVVTRTEELWVSDITYICVGNDFNYLFLITDAYSHKIVGYCLHYLLANDGALLALEMALKSRTDLQIKLIHHSDRGVQYCSFEYVNALIENKVLISMTENGEAYENAIAERVNGILKTEFRLNKLFRTQNDALTTIHQAIEAYNLKRPHMSCGYLTPSQAHETKLELVKLWKPRKRKLDKKAVEIISNDS